MVHEYENGTWKPNLVILNCNRAIVCGEWNAFGTTFVIGTATCDCFIGSYTDELDWWKCDKLAVKNTKATVNVAKFHPSGRVVAVASLDRKVGLYTCHVVGEEKGKVEKDLYESYSGLFSDVETFGEKLFVIKDTYSWVNDACFSPSGGLMAFTSKLLIKITYIFSTRLYC